MCACGFSGAQPSAPAPAQSPATARTWPETPGFKTQERARESTKTQERALALTVPRLVLPHLLIILPAPLSGGLCHHFPKGGAWTAFVTCPEMETTVFPPLLGNCISMAASVPRGKAGAQEGMLLARTQATSVHSGAKGKPPLQLAQFCPAAAPSVALIFDGRENSYTLLFTSNRQTRSCSHTWAEAHLDTPANPHRQVCALTPTQTPYTHHIHITHPAPVPTHHRDPLTPSAGQT